MICWTLVRLDHHLGNFLGNWTCERFDFPPDPWATATLLHTAHIFVLFPTDPRYTLGKLQLLHLLCNWLPRIAVGRPCSNFQAKEHLHHSRHLPSHFSRSLFGLLSFLSLHPPPPLSLSIILALQGFSGYVSSTIDSQARPVKGANSSSMHP